ERGRHQERAAQAARVPARLHRAPPAAGERTMNDDLRKDAEDRLLDAALEQVLGARTDAAPPPRQRWLAAGLVLLGISVVVVLWSEMRGAPRAVPVPAAQGGAQEPQSPAPLPPMVTAKGRAALDALPADTQNLNVVDAPADLAPL